MSVCNDYTGCNGACTDGGQCGDRRPDPVREQQIDPLSARMVILENALQRIADNCSAWQGIIAREALDSKNEDNKGFSEETCIRCGWRMGDSPLNCQNNNTPHVFPSQSALEAALRDEATEHHALRWMLGLDVHQGETRTSTEDAVANLISLHRAALREDNE